MPNTTLYTVISTPIGGPESVGSSYIVPDMICWFDTSTSDGFVTNGPVKIADQAPFPDGEEARHPVYVEEIREQEASHA